MGGPSAIGTLDSRGALVEGGMRALSPESAGYRALSLQNDAPTWRARVKRFGGRTRR